MYFCSFLLLLGGIGFLYKNTDLIIAVLTMTFLFQLPWTIDMISIVLTGKIYLGTAGYLFHVKKPEYFIAMRHLFMVPALFYGFTMLPARSHRGKVAPFYTMAIFLLGVLIPSVFAPSGRNINYSNMITSPFHYSTSGEPNIIFFIIALICGATILGSFAHYVGLIHMRDKRWKHFFVRFAEVWAILGVIIAIFGFFVLF